MFKTLIRAVLVIVVLVGVGAFLLGWWGSGRLRPDTEPVDSRNPAGANTERAREIGAEVGERTAVAAATREEVRVPLRRSVAHSRARPRFYRTGPCMSQAVRT